MLQRIFVFLLFILCAANLASAQKLPIANASDSNDVALAEWKVSYDDNEKWPKHHYKKRPVTAIRLQIVYKNNKHYGQLWLFTGNLGSYSRLGKTDQFELDIDNTAGNARMRIGFRATKVDLNLTAGGSKKINVNGIWQPGRDTTKRENQRIQLKIDHNPTFVSSTTSELPSPLQAPLPKDAGGPVPVSNNCDDDPDSDVLEEGTPPDPCNPDGAPTEP